MLASIIIPCYNEELVIDDTYKRVTDVLIENNIDYEIIFINDGSSDSTLEKLLNFSKINNSVKIIDFSRNFGHQPAVTAGINNCTGDIAIIIDADLQDPPELFPEMIKIYKETDANIVYGLRKSRDKETIFKKATAKFFYRLLNSMSDVRFPVDTGDFRLIDRKVINTFNDLNERNKYIRGLISWMGFKQVPIEYHRSARLKGETKYTFKKMLNLAFRGIFYFSKKPLKVSITLGIISIIVAFLILAYVLVSKFVPVIPSVKGWGSTLITIIFFGGVQLFMLGVIGEYIGNIFEELKGRPEYIIKDIHSYDTKNSPDKNQK